GSRRGAAGRVGPVAGRVAAGRGRVGLVGGGLAAEVRVLAGWASQSAGGHGFRLRGAAGRGRVGAAGVGGGDRSPTGSGGVDAGGRRVGHLPADRKSTRLISSHVKS